MNYVDNPFQSPAVISFCPGILGLERGLAKAGVHCRVMAYVEIEAFIIANLVAGMEAGLLGAAPVWTDAKTFDARPFRGRVHGIIGGYPCPGESLAGLREGHLYKGFIWPAIRRAIAAARPLWCYFENVDDHLTGTYPIVQRSLRNMGYAVEAGIFSAEETGAPQERQRLFILAVANSYRNAAGRFAGNLFGQGGTAERATQGQNGQRCRNESGNGGKEMEHTINTGCGESRRAVPIQPEITGPAYTGKELGNAEGDNQRREWESYGGHQKQAGRSGSQFPMGQGYEQYEWEEPRTVEPGLGCTVDGYRFREDLLRALGNSVVEQTAEIAFRTLLDKHFKA